MKNSKLHCNSYIVAVSLAFWIAKITKQGSN
jgi:hypothetical protein